jgi:hypothetical protein
MRTPFERGQYARQHGRPITDNPYKRRTQWHAWDAGWRSQAGTETDAERSHVELLAKRHATATLPAGDWEMTDAEYVAFLERRYDDQAARAEWYRRCDFPECMSEDMWRTAAATFEDLQTARGNRPGR